MAQITIKNLPELIDKTIGTNTTVTSVDIKRLTAPGENYASLVVKVDVNLKKENGNSEILQAVGKLPVTSGALKDSPLADFIFKNEIGFYTRMVPTLQEFLREQGVKDDILDIFPNIYGARINLKEDSDRVDENAAVLLEYLEDYANVDRTIGYDFEEAKLVLKSLAVFHAAPLALKIKKPEVFEKNIKAYIEDLPPLPEGVKKSHSEPSAILLEIFEESDKFAYLVPKIKEHIPKAKTMLFLSPPREPFSTLVHRDMWINNSMIKFDNGKPVHCKLVDFQVIGHSSPANDLFFFLFTSIKTSALEENLDDLIKFYHKHFFKTLEMLGCDTTNFGLPAFLEEIRTAAKQEFIHALHFAVFVVLRKKAGLDEIIEIGPPDIEKMREDMSLEAKEKALFIALECDKRGWL